MNKKKRKSLAGRVIWLIVIPAVAIPMILVVYFLFYSFKDAISNTVYSDLESLVEINTAFAGKLLENNDNREDLLSELKPLYNSQIVIGETGFIFCVDLSGNLIDHKKVEGENWKDKGVIAHIIDKKNGFHRYISPKTGTYKLAAFRQLPGTDIIIVASAFEADFLQKPTRQIIITSAIILILSMSMGVLYSIILIRRIISNPLKKIVANTMDLTNNADLTIQFYDKRRANDEIKIIFNGLNDFVIRLGEIVKSIKDSTDNTLDRKNMMVEKTRVMTQSVSDISQLLGEESKIIEEIYKMIGTCSGGTGNINQRIDDLSDIISEQVSMVEQSSAAINQMLASVSSVARITFDQAEITESLVKASDEGFRKITESAVIAQDISDSVDDIKGTAQVISAISAQTNLLAMNAAIEAAHAGDAGRGFAVVADEIRKLAESSNKNSKRIADTIKTVVEKISQNTAMSQDTVSVFKKINKDMSTISERVEETAKSMEEMKIGGDQIVIAISRLQEISFDVDGAGKDILENSGSVKSMMGRLAILAENLKVAMDKIENKSDAISTNIDALNSGVDDVSSAADGIEQVISVFKT